MNHGRAAAAEPPATAEQPECTFTISPHGAVQGVIFQLSSPRDRGLVTTKGVQASPFPKTSNAAADLNQVEQKCDEHLRALSARTTRGHQAEDRLKGRRGCSPRTQTQLQAVTLLQLPPGRSWGMLYLETPAHFVPFDGSAHKTEGEGPWWLQSSGSVGGKQTSVTGLMTFGAPRCSDVPGGAGENWRTPSSRDPTSRPWGAWGLQTRPRAAASPASRWGVCVHLVEEHQVPKSWKHSLHPVCVTATSPLCDFCENLSDEVEKEDTLCLKIINLEERVFPVTSGMIYDTMMCVS